MKMDEIMSVLAMFARSQGFYGRLLRDIDELFWDEPEQYEKLVAELERQDFRTPLDVVMYFEC